jgi:hypothetical protein
MKDYETAVRETAAWQIANLALAWQRLLVCLFSALHLRALGNAAIDQAEEVQMRMAEMLRAPK